MALLTATQLREHLTDTDLSDTALQRHLDAADRSIKERYGAHAGTGDVTEQLEGSDEWLLPRRTVSTITSVTEYVGGPNAEVSTVLATDDYRIWDEGQALQRIASGTNPRTTWGSRVEVVFAPEDDDAVRTQVTIDLCRLAVEYDAKKSIRDGSFAMTPVDYQNERERLLSEIKTTTFGPVTVA